MSRSSLGPRLWMDEARQEWVIRDGKTFIRTGAKGWRKAQDSLNQYMDKRGPVLRQIPPLTSLDGFIYFITADYPDFPIKIGFTRRDDFRRKRYLQISCPYEIVLLGMFSGRQSDERKLHRQFVTTRLRSEWFSRSDELLALIKERTST